MDLTTVGERYRSVYQTLDGAAFFGEISAPSALDNPNRMEQPRLFLKVHPETRGLAAGVLIKAHGLVYLLADNSPSDREAVVFQSYKLIRCERQLAWKRPAAAIDPVTKLEKSNTTPTDMGLIYATMDPQRMVEDSIQISEQQYSLYTNAALQPADIVGPYRVLVVDTLLGVTVATVR